MTDEELIEFVRSMMSSMELRMEQRYKAQLKELDAILERYCPSTEALLDSSSQPDSPEEALDIAVDKDLIRDGSKAQPKLNRSSLEVEEKLSARMEIGVSRISPGLDRAIRSSCVYIQEDDASGVFVDRKMVLREIVFSVNGGSPLESIHTPQKDRRRIFDRGRQWIFDRRRRTNFDEDERTERVTGGRREAWSRRIASQIAQWQTEATTILAVYSLHTMAEKHQAENGGETADTGCGMFDFLKKKENDKPQQPQEEVAKKDQHHQSRDADSSSSSSDEEDGNGEKRKKKGLKDKIKERISGKKEGEHTDDVHATEIKTNNHIENEKTVNPEEKGFLEKIKDKLPGQHKKAENHGANAECGAEGHKSHDDESKEKKGIFEKIKEKLPVGHKEEERAKEN
ncbi:hypothetical protein G4B88_021630 [Cannabis sativa]|uniref:Uncharacterized protein n=1 Tax=Cannabis sativa TaxID=3483 RepID=A0A7J6GIZ6_CANSA|nr:hypothetical protein G4B88_021630 [Cannabis sativa]